MEQDPTEGEDLDLGEIVAWAEFACWTTLALAPFLYWVNGPAVSPDQFVVRCGLVTIAVLGALGLRTRKLLLARRRSKNK